MNDGNSIKIRQNEEVDKLNEFVAIPLYCEKQETVLQAKLDLI